LILMAAEMGEGGGCIVAISAELDAFDGIEETMAVPLCPAV
jgi:hypothetical protein